MEYDDKNKPADDNLTALALSNITARLNDAYRAIAELRSTVDALTARIDDADNMTSEEFSNHVVQQVANQMPVILAAANKAKRGGRR
ncbi:hypothetical protein MOP88_14355 [Sphingomonas sp. WKB10]|nr:hypothetical protein [Sphingomonas sp. WKB10]